MHQPLRPAALLATLVVLSFGCGHKPKPEMPEPVSQEEAPQQIDTPATPSKVSDEPAPAKGLDDAQRIALQERIGFEFDRSDLSAEAREKLSAKVEILRDLPDLSVRVEGHADERGSDEYNLALSNRRAAAAMRYLISQGIAQERLEVVGYGEERPLDPAETEAAWAKNRRDEFRVTSGRLAQQ